MIKVDITREIKRYKGVEKLSVQTTFSTAAITQISGPSGVGKTTLLRIIAGLLLPERGLIIANGATWLDTDKGVNLSVQSRNVGFVFQDYALFPNMTVREHLNYGTKDREWIDRLLALGRMDTFSDQKPKELSGGQQQRLALLRALSTKPSLMLMDEPFSALDRSLKSALLPELKTLFLEMDITALIVTHYPTELENIADYTLEI